MKKSLIAIALAGTMTAAMANDVTPRFANGNLPALTTATISAQNVNQVQTFDGVLEAINQSTVSAQTSGRVLEVGVDVGDEVKKGNLIVRITDTEQRARVASAQAQFDEASAQYDRLKKMYASKLVAKANLDQAEAAFKSAKAGLEEARQNLTYTKVYAPYDGIVMSRSVKVGESVAPGSPLMAGLSLEALRVQVNIPQSSIGAVRAYRQAQISTSSNSFVSTDLRIPPSADSMTHTFKVLVNLPEGKHDLFPGTMAKVSFVTGSREELSVPEEWVAHRGEVTGVYVLADNGLQFRFVRLGSLAEDGRYPVLAGLSEGEHIAVNPIEAAVAYKNSRMVEAN